MARRDLKKLDPERINSLASFSSEQGAGETRRLEPKKGRSRRGLALNDDTTQVCFRIDRDRHKRIRVYCAENEIEIGELMDSLLKKSNL